MYSASTFPTNDYSNSAVKYPDMNNLNYYAGDSGESGSQASSLSGSMSQPSSHSNPIDGEPPLLEELGIHPADIFRRTLAVALPFKSLPDNVDDSDADLAGPFCFCLALGCCLLLAGKVHFGYIYGFSLVSCLLMYILINLMSDSAISIDRTASILGYALVPLVALAAVVIFIDCRGAIGLCLTVTIIAWCAINATRMFEKSMQMREQRYLIAYPSAIIYAVFALLTIF